MRCVLVGGGRCCDTVQAVEIETQRAAEKDRRRVCVREAREQLRSPSISPPVDSTLEPTLRPPPTVGGDSERASFLSFFPIVHGG